LFSSNNRSQLGDPERWTKPGRTKNAISRSVLILRDVPTLVNARFWDETSNGIYIRWPADVGPKRVIVRVRVFGVDTSRIRAELERNRVSIQRAAQLKYDAMAVG
jgi:hypothetical protein